MAAETQAGIMETDVSKKILQLLAGMKSTPTGVAVLQHLTQLLNESTFAQREVEQAYAGLVTLLLEACIQRMPVDGPLRVHLKLLQMRLTPPLTAAEIGALKRYVESYLRDLGEIRDEARVVFAQAFLPLLKSFGASVDSPGESAQANNTTTVLSTPTPVTAFKSVTGLRPVYTPVAVTAHPLTTPAPMDIDAAALTPRVTVPPVTFPSPISVPSPVAAPSPVPAQAVTMPSPMPSEQVSALPPITEPSSTAADRVTSILANEVPWGATGSTEGLDPARRVQVERRADQTYRQHLQEKRRSILSISEVLQREVSDLKRQNDEFGAQLEIELGRLQRAGNIQAVEVLRQALINETQNLLRNNRGFAEILEGTSASLLEIKSDTDKISDELARVHLLSLTDELTNLSNRRAFMQRLEDEVGRVQRYGANLALAILDLDEFKEVNDQYGHVAGDEALRSFAGNILSVFRQLDLVARYGGEEFAVLMPNTDTEGALCALRKVQKRAGESHYLYNGIVIPMPTFSAGLAQYRAGESATNFIRRADSALYRAKRLGRNRLEADSSSVGMAQGAG